jgi:hypothetical protein
MKLRNILIIFAALAAFSIPSAAMADYTDYVPGVGTVKVYYVSGSGNSMTFKVTVPDGRSYIIPGSIDLNGRGVPDAAALAQASNNKLASVQPPSTIQSSASIIDSSERREAQFKSENPEVSSNELLIGYPSGNLAVDSNTTARETATVALRVIGTARGSEAWSLTSDINNSDPLTVEKANEIMEGTGYMVADLNGDGIIQRGELFDSIPANPAGADQGETVPSIPTVPSDEPYASVSDGTPSEPSEMPSSPSSDVLSCSFNSDKDNILINQRAELIWNCRNADSCSITPNIGNVGVSGNRTIAPNRSTTYILTCAGKGKTTSLSATINVYEVFIEEVPSDQ